MGEAGPSVLGLGWLYPASLGNGAGVPSWAAALLDDIWVGEGECLGVTSAGAAAQGRHCRDSSSDSGSMQDLRRKLAAWQVEVPYCPIAPLPFFLNLAPSKLCSEATERPEGVL